MTQTQADFKEWDRQVIAEFRANGGQVGGPFAGSPVLLLTTTGARSGEPRTNPLSYLSTEGQIYVFAGNRGASTNPAWYHNLVAHPDVTVEVGAERFAATAIVLDDAESQRLGNLQMQKMPALAERFAKMTRKVPAILLQRKG